MTNPSRGIAGPMAERLKRAEFEVRAVPHADARAFIKREHYAQGSANTSVYRHGLFRRGDGKLLGVAMWMPPTRVAAESVNREDWRRVLALSRLAISAEVPANGASFLLGRSIRLIAAEGRFATLVTYADESQGHTGAIYRATNWRYVGRTGPYPRWVDADGKQVSRLATKSRRKADMLTLGYREGGSFHKHKFVLSVPA